MECVFSISYMDCVSFGNDFYKELYFTWRRYHIINEIVLVNGVSRLHINSIECVTSKRFVKSTVFIT